MSNPQIQALTTLTWAQYVPLARRTASLSTPVLGSRRITDANHTSIGLLSELGELFELLRRLRLNEIPLEEAGTNLKEELGDVTWYLALTDNLESPLTLSGAVELPDNLAYAMGDLVIACGPMGDVCKRALHYNSGDFLDPTAYEKIVKEFGRVDLVLGRAVRAVQSVVATHTQSWWCTDPNDPSVDRSFTFGEVLASNIRKLDIRMGAKFDGVKVHDRDLEAEKAALETSSTPNLN